MRMESAAAAKGSKRPVNSQPGEGTQIRAIYDLFMANKGWPVQITFSNRGQSSYRKLSDLRDFYGLDIRKIQRGVWVLAGEWINGRYVDYIAQVIEEKSP